MASQGPLAPSTAADDATVGAAAWINTSNALTENGVESTNGAAFSQISDYLKTTNYGFSVPSGATIDGIVLEVKRRAQGAAGFHKDNSVKLVKGGTIGGTDKADTVTTWGSTLAWITYGTSSDLWGLTWTDTDINASTFGAVFSYLCGSGQNGGAVDAMRITVYYTASGGSGSTAATMLSLGLNVA